MRVTSGYFYFKVGENYQLTEHFNTKEFECHKFCMANGLDESFQRISIELVGCLEAIRRAAASPIKVTSGFRTAAYQQYLRDEGYQTSKGISTHELGDAADITSEISIQKLKYWATPFFDAVGVGKNFIHVDTRRRKFRSWSYGNK